MLAGGESSHGEAPLTLAGVIARGESTSRPPYRPRFVLVPEGCLSAPSARENASGEEGVESGVVSHSLRVGGGESRLV